jgi:ParB family chromosome partitioning protein
MRLLALPERVQKALSEGDVTEGHARAILSLEGEEKQLALLDLIVREGLTVREAEKRAESLRRPSQLRKKPEADLETQEKEEELSSILGSRVRIKKKSRGGGQVVIECYSKDNLEGILDKLGRINA